MWECISVENKLYDKTNMDMRMKICFIVIVVKMKKMIQEKSWMVTQWEFVNCQIKKLRKRNVLSFPSVFHFIKGSGGKNNIDWCVLVLPHSLCLSAFRLLLWRQRCITPWEFIVWSWEEKSSSWFSKKHQQIEKLNIYY